MKRILICIAAVAISGCVTTSEMPIAKNEVRLDTDARGALYAGHAGDVTMLKAAQATLKNGYTKFRFAQVGTGQGSQLVGINSYGSASIYGNSVYGSGFSSPVYAPTSRVSVTVVMLNDGDPGAKDAWDAKAILKKYGRHPS